MPRTKRAKRMIVSTRQQWNAVNSPLRLQMIAVFESVGPMSVAELAEHLNLAADGLYHHIKIMLKAKLLVDLGFRKSTRIPEAVYDLSADKIDFEVDLAKGRNVEHLDKLNKAVMRNASRVLQAALTSGDGNLAGAGRNIYARYETAWLDDKDLAKVREHIEAISKIFRSSRTRKTGTLMMANCNLSPLPTSTRKTAKE